MYSVVIADDEFYIREELAKLVPLINNSFDVVKTFENGTDLIEYIKDNDVDLILTDILMPGFTGIDIAKYVHENNLPSLVVFISAYKKFEYAHEAISYNVKHYLLKPTKARNIEEMLSQIETELKKKKLLNDASSKTGLFDETSFFFEQQIYFDILTGSLTDKEKIYKQLSKVGKLKYPDKSICTLIEVVINDYDDFLKESWEYLEDDFKMTLKNIFRDENEIINYIVISNKDGKIILFALSREIMSKDSFLDKVNNHLENSKKNLKEIFSLESEFELKNVFDSIYDASGCLKDLAVKTHNVSNKYISSIIATGNEEEILLFIDEFINQVKHLSGEELRKSISDMLLTLVSDFNYNNIEINQIFSEQFNIQKIVGFSSENIEELKLWLEEFLIKLSKVCTTDKTDYTRLHVEKAIKYMKENYKNDITLENVADYVYLNSVYFSRVFKQYTGERFTDYLIKIRMEAAIDLLKKKRYKIYEISSRVGIGSSKYFFRLFKKYTGYAPKEYYAMLLKQEESKTVKSGEENEN